ncbi:hypothetical protein CO662_29275 [Rhizobium anhuiense]|uniref:Transposase n=1 Tax=Rhizobium anhuiense TaxID=1184720 RepID=A0ABX4J188_9HYPH|nr:hypothetical protein [Rhizobium anhuiense]PDS48577.1 hypothetical protein CO662_29275 [Rhizobium anhuiense]
MKTPRRNFVVEYKTNRRQAPARPPSIWGNLDLQAVARQIEADGILVGAARQDPHVTNRGKAPIAAIAPSQHSQAPVEDHTLTSSELTVASDDGVFHEELPQELPAIEAPTVRDRGRIAGKSAGSSIRDERVSIQERTVVQGCFEVSPHRNGEDDLDALEEENRRLKRLMIIKLRQENAELKSMLKRVDPEQIERST